MTHDRLTAGAEAVQATTRLATPTHVQPATGAQPATEPPRDAAHAPRDAAPVTDGPRPVTERATRRTAEPPTPGAAADAPLESRPTRTPEMSPAAPERPVMSSEQVADLGREIEALYVREGRLGRDLRVDLGELGSVRVQVQSEGGRLDVHLDASTRDAAAALGEVRGELEGRLADRGYADARVAVTDDSGGRQSGQSPHQQDRGERQDHAALLESLRTHRLSRPTGRAFTAGAAARQGTSWGAA